MRDFAFTELDLQDMRQALRARAEDLIRNKTSRTVQAKLSDPPPPSANPSEPQSAQSPPKEVL